MSEYVKTTREGVYGILLFERQVLMCHTVCHRRTIKNFPGGGIKLGEELKEALAREFLEETGVAANVGPHLYTSDDKVFVAPDYPGEQLRYHYYLVSTEVEHLNLDGNGDDVDRLEWFPVEALPEADMLEVDRAAWKAIAASLPSLHRTGGRA